MFSSEHVNWDQTHFDLALESALFWGLTAFTTYLLLIAAPVALRVIRGVVLGG